MKLLEDFLIASGITLWLMMIGMFTGYVKIDFLF